ncbi:MAG: GH151, partial [uncultured Chloroflexi bacterium]
ELSKHRPGHQTRASAGAGAGAGAVVPARDALGADQHPRDRRGAGPPRHRVVDRPLEEDADPGNHRQRRRDRGVLPQHVRAAPALAVPGRARPVRRGDRGGAQERDRGGGAHGLVACQRALLLRASRLVHGGRGGTALQGGRLRRPLLHRVHQRPVLPRVPARRAAGDLRALQAGGVLGQLVVGAVARADLLLPQLPRGLWRAQRR